MGTTRRGGPFLNLLPAAVALAAALAGASGASRAAGANDPSRGRAFLEVRSDPGGGSGQVRAGVDIAVPPEQVWRVLVDCDRAPKLARSLKSCRILERDPQGRWDLREQISRPILFFPAVRTLVRSDFDPPHILRFHGEGGDLKVLTGEWRLEPIDGGSHTRVTYAGRASVPFDLPGAIARLALREQVALALTALNRECLAGA